MSDHSLCNLIDENLTILTQTYSIQTGAAKAIHSTYLFKEFCFDSFNESNRDYE